MSASVGVYAAVALFLAIGGDTEEVMRERMRLEAEENCEVFQPIRTRPPRTSRTRRILRPSKLWLTWPTLAFRGPIGRGRPVTR